MAKQVAITTYDNPYDPLDDFDNWYNYDISHGYYTAQYLARVATTSIGFSNNDNTNAISDAIDEIIYFNGNNFYKKIERE